MGTMSFFRNKDEKLKDIIEHINEINKMNKTEIVPKSFIWEKPRLNNLKQVIEELTHDFAKIKEEANIYYKNTNQPVNVDEILKTLKNINIQLTIIIDTKLTDDKRKDEEILNSCKENADWINLAVPRLMAELSRIETNKIDPTARIRYG
jgi:hypothetical protein